MMHRVPPHSPAHPHRPSALAGPSVSNHTGSILTPQSPSFAASPKDGAGRVRWLQAASPGSLSAVSVLPRSHAPSTSHSHCRLGGPAYVPPARPQDEGGGKRCPENRLPSEALSSASVDAQAAAWRGGRHCPGRVVRAARVSRGPRKWVRPEQKRGAQGCPPGGRPARREGTTPCHVAVMPCGDACSHAQPRFLTLSFQLTSQLFSSGFTRWSVLRFLPFLTGLVYAPRGGRSPHSIRTPTPRLEPSGSLPLLRG